MSTTRKRPAATPAERSALDALQEVLDEERVVVAAERLKTERQLEALRLRIDELESEVAGTSARLRELESQLQARNR
ncbi:MAG: hypothetical protein JWN44_7244 [Myxococcales bacterium]|nr:hypothetical protein [Myxococcales bacterium]